MTNFRFETSKKLLALIAVGLVFNAGMLQAQDNNPQRAAFEERQQARKMILSLSTKARDEKVCKSEQCNSAWANFESLAPSFGAMGPKADPASNEALRASYSKALITAMDAAIQDNPDWQNDPEAARYLAKYNDARSQLAGSPPSNVPSVASIFNASMSPATLRTDLPYSPKDMLAGGVPTPRPLCSGGCTHPIKHALCDAACWAAAAAGALATCPETGPLALLCVAAWAAGASLCADLVCSKYCN